MFLMSEVPLYNPLQDPTVPPITPAVVLGGGRRLMSEEPCRGTSLTRERLPLGPYRKPMPRALWWS